jgi:hypothetical protein
VAETSTARWIPISALPLDLQAVLLRTIDWRHPHAPDAPKRGLIVGLIMTALGVANAMNAVGAPAFSSPVRVVLLSVGPLFVLLHLASVYGRGFRSRQRRGLSFGPASAVFVDAHHVRVLPAEGLSIAGRRIKYGAEAIEHEEGDVELLEHVKGLIEAVRQKPELVEHDRFRAAALQTPTLRLSTVRSRAREATLMALLLAIVPVLLVEAGPIHARDQRRSVDAKVGLALETRRRDLIGSHTKFLFEAMKLAHDAEVRRTREPMLERALTGSSDDVRIFLSNFGASDADAPRVQKRLAEFCATQISFNDADWPQIRGFRAVLRGVCETDNATLYYSHEGTVPSDSVESFIRDRYWEELLAATSSARAFHPKTIRVVAVDAGKAKFPFVSVVTKNLVQAMTGQRVRRTFDITLIPHDLTGKPVPKAVYQKHVVAM